ncbi:DNA polymerase IV [Vallicoccus soli]|uniref:DNA polymerase IV n=1 Tax=Vallicoccus soli TaxID=2339232 RepID=UPI0015AA1339|nr:DNA polymerase IV [Vallicoccus soli]
MRSGPSVLHVDLDAFYASVEQLDKPSLAGRAVVVGGTGPRGVVATASYEARRHGVRSAMSGAEARARAPHAAFLAPRFAAYAAVSGVVMRVLRELSPLVEPLSLDEAFVDLAAGPLGDLDEDGVRAAAHAVKERVHALTGVRASVGAAGTKLLAKVASDLDKPDGLVVVPLGTEAALLAPLPVTRLWGVGPATAERLRRAGVHTVGELAQVPEAELVGLLGQAHGTALSRHARGLDERSVEPEREAKSVSAEDTFPRDLVEPALLAHELERLVVRVVDRLRRDGQTGRTVTLKVRRHDFSTLTRSVTLPGPTDDRRTVGRVARDLLAGTDVSGGVRLLGVGVSGLADWAQADLFDAAAEEPAAAGADPAPAAPVATGPERPDWSPGLDVVHDEHGRGWVWGGGLGRVTVRFEHRGTAPGPVRTLRADDPALHPLPAAEVAATAVRAPLAAAGA